MTASVEYGLQSEGAVQSESPSATPTAPTAIASSSSLPLKRSPAWTRMDTHTQ